MSEVRVWESPLVSVLMAVFNGHRYLPTAVQSVLGQTLRDIEFIIVDDGSTDDSPRILRRFCQKDARVRVLTRPNQGLTKSLNEGLRLVRGKYLARMDSDDICLPQRFEKQARFLDENPDHVAVGSRCMLIDPDGYPICEKRDLAPAHEQIDELLMKAKWPIVHPSVMMRTDAVKQIGGYDERYRTNQDHDLFLRLAEVGKLANLQEVLLLYRQHFQSVGFTKVVDQTNNVLKIVKAAHARRGLVFNEERPPDRIQILQPRDHRRNWAWSALAAGNLGTARRHALAVARSAPFARDSWRLVYCAMRGR